MRISRRQMLQFSATLLGPGILDFLRTPTWRWSTLPIFRPRRFPLRLRKARLQKCSLWMWRVRPDSRHPNVWGGVDRKSYIVEAKGSGIAFFDYDMDGWLDIYLTNGTRLNTTWPSGQEPATQLYHNNRDGTFTDVTAKSGLARTGWQTGVCVGDYNNDGWDDLFCSFWGHNILFRNNGDGTFTDVTKKAGLWKDEIRWGSGCTWLDYDRDGLARSFCSGSRRSSIEQRSSPMVPMKPLVNHVPSRASPSPGRPGCALRPTAPTGWVRSSAGCLSCRR